MRIYRNIPLLLLVCACYTVFFLVLYMADIAFTEPKGSVLFYDQDKSIIEFTRHFDIEDEDRIAFSPNDLIGIINNTGASEAAVRSDIYVENTMSKYTLYLCLSDGFYPRSMIKDKSNDKGGVYIGKVIYNTLKDDSITFAGHTYNIAGVLYDDAFDDAANSILVDLSAFSETEREELLGEIEQRDLLVYFDVILFDLPEKIKSIHDNFVKKAEECGLNVKIVKAHRANTHTVMENALLNYKKILSFLGLFFSFISLYAGLRLLLDECSHNIILYGILGYKKSAIIKMIYLEQGAISFFCMTFSFCIGCVVNFIFGVRPFINVFSRVFLTIYMMGFIFCITLAALMTVHFFKEKKNA